MQTRARRLRRTMPIVAVAALLAVGCGNDNSAENLDLTDAEADPSVEGEVAITGSSTVEPLSTLTAEAFGAQNPDVAISTEGPGTGDGFERFCEGGADITGASRPIKAEELEACADAGIEVIELPVALDGITVVVPLESPVECLSFADLYALVGPEAEGAERWTDAAPLAEQLGSSTTMPDLQLALTGPGEESGTYDSFVEQVLTPIAEARVEEGAIAEEDAEATRTDYSSSANDNTIIGSVAADPGGLGWVGFAYAQESRDVRKVPVVGRARRAVHRPVDHDHPGRVVPDRPHPLHLRLGDRGRAPRGRRGGRLLPRRPPRPRRPGRPDPDRGPGHDRCDLDRPHPRTAPAGLTAVEPPGRVPVGGARVAGG